MAHRVTTQTHECKEHHEVYHWIPGHHSVAHERMLGWDNSVPHGVILTLPNTIVKHYIRGQTELPHEGQNYPTLPYTEILVVVIT
jgi:adenylate cyclase